jgi:hypothetical protein
MQVFCHEPAGISLHLGGFEAVMFAAGREEICSTHFVVMQTELDGTENFSPAGEFSFLFYYFSYLFDIKISTKYF